MLFAKRWMRAKPSSPQLLPQESDWEEKEKEKERWRKEEKSIRNSTN